VAWAERSCARRRGNVWLLDGRIVYGNDHVELRRLLRESRNWLEPISKSFEEDDEAGKLDEAEEVVGVIFPADEDSTLPLYPGEKALDQPATHVTA
jgi:hypothetical protein